MNSQLKGSRSQTTELLKPVIYLDSSGRFCCQNRVPEIISISVRIWSILCLFWVCLHLTTSVSAYVEFPVRSFGKWETTYLCTNCWNNVRLGGEQPFSEVVGEGGKTF